jgi:hypothetical protein
VPDGKNPALPGFGAIILEAFFGHPGHYLSLERCLMAGRMIFAEIAIQTFLSLCLDRLRQDFIRRSLVSLDRLSCEPKAWTALQSQLPILAARWRRIVLLFLLFDRGEIPD